MPGSPGSSQGYGRRPPAGQNMRLAEDGLTISVWQVYRANSETLTAGCAGRLRYCIWHNWKKPERKRKNLIRLGMDHSHAYGWSRTRMGGWAVAQMLCIHEYH